MYRDKFTISLGAHTHKTNVMAPESYEIPDLNFVQIVSAAVSPIYYNNPSYSFLEFDDDVKVEDFSSRFFLINDYHHNGTLEWKDYSVAQSLGVDLNNARSVR